MPGSDYSVHTNLLTKSSLFIEAFTLLRYANVAYLPGSDPPNAILGPLHVLFIIIPSDEHLKKSKVPIHKGAMLRENPMENEAPVYKRERTRYMNESYILVEEHLAERIHIERFRSASMTITARMWDSQVRWWVVRDWCEWRWWVSIGLCTTVSYILSATTRYLHPHN